MLGAGRPDQRAVAAHELRSPGKLLGADTLTVVRATDSHGRSSGVRSVPIDGVDSTTRSAKACRLR